MFTIQRFSLSKGPKKVFIVQSWEVFTDTGYQWRSQGGGPLGNCPVLENLLPKDFWRWWLLPSIENFDRYVVSKNSVGFSKNSVEFSKNSVEFSKKFYGLTANYRTECRLVSDEIFLYFFSTLQWKLMYFTDNQL